MGLHYEETLAHSRRSCTSPTATTAYTSSTAGNTSRGYRTFKIKALKTFGSISIRGKLAAFHSVFPHDDNATVNNIAGIYDDVLDFSRPGLYSESVARAAWKLLVVQIASRNTYHLTQALNRWPLPNLQTFLHTLADKCMTDVENPYDSVHRKDKGDRLSSSSSEVVVLTPVLKFVTHIATQNDLASQTVLEAGILDMLLRIYVIFPALSGSLPEDVGRKLALMDACRSIVIVLGMSSETLVFNHPVCILWTDRNSEHLDNPFKERCDAWRRTSRPCALRRLVVIYINSLWKSVNDIISGREACIDIVEFTNHEFYDPEIVDLAYLAILKHITLSGDTAQHLVDVLADCSREHTARIFSGVIRLWLECIGLQIKNDALTRPAQPTDPTDVNEEHFQFIKCTEIEEVTLDKTFYGHAKRDLWKRIVDVDAALIHVIQFATRAARQNTIRLGMLDAGGLVIVLAAFANSNFKLAGLISVPTREGEVKRAKSKHGRSVDVTHKTLLPLSTVAINAAAATLLVVMRYAAFREFWGDHRFNARLSFCSSLVDSLLGDDEAEWGSRETRTLFKEIVSL